MRPGISVLLDLFIYIIERAPPILVFPNPVTNSFSIVSAGDIQGQTLRLMDVQGRVISETTYRDGMIVDMDDMAAGIYRVMILSSSNETVHVQQVLKTD